MLPPDETLGHREITNEVEAGNKSTGKHVQIKLMRRTRRCQQQRRRRIQLASFMYHYPYHSWRWWILHWNWRRSISGGTVAVLRVLRGAAINSSTIDNGCCYEFLEELLSISPVHVSAASLMIKLLYANPLSSTVMSVFTSQTLCYYKNIEKYWIWIFD